MGAPGEQSPGATRPGTDDATDDELDWVIGSECAESRFPACQPVIVGVRADPVPDVCVPINDIDRAVLNVHRDRPVLSAMASPVGVL